MPPIEQINDTTYSFKMPSGDVVGVGNKESSKFKSHLKINRWDGECFICPSIEQAGATELRVKDDLVESESNLSLIRMYPIAPSKQWELGSFRMEIVHKKKPKSNKVLSSILSHNVKVFYQPPLTQEQTEQGLIRPDNIIGSYAFYHATRQPMHASKAIAEKYRCCKVGHKPRPRIVDDNGDWCWAELFIDLKTGLQIITIPQEFYEYAKYPIRHDAGADTFGYTGSGVSNLSFEDIITGGVYTGAIGNADSITALLYHDYPADITYCFALYKDSDKSLIGQTVAESERVSDWRTLAFSSPPEIEAVDYGICIWGNSVSGNHYLKYDSGTGGYRYYRALSYTGTYPSPSGTASYDVENVSIYCTYTPEAVAGQPTMKRWGGVPFMEPRGRGVW